MFISGISGGIYYRHFYRRGSGSDLLCYYFCAQPGLKDEVTDKKGV
jgi:hypothetical protein